MNGQNETKEKESAKLKEKRRKFMEDFRKFIARGNVVDLAVAVVIGAAFNKIVTQFVASLITPILSLILGGLNMNDWKIVLRDAVLAADGTVEKAEIAITYGTLLSVIIDFLITALCVFIIARTYNKIKKQLDQEREKIVARLREDEIAKKAEEEAAAKQKLEEEARIAAEKKALEDRIAAEKLAEEEAAAAEEAGMQIVAYEAYSSSTLDLSSVIMKLIAAEPDVLLLTSYVNDGALFARQAAELGFTVPILITHSGGHSVQAFVDAVGDQVNYLLTVDPVPCNPRLDSFSGSASEYRFFY